MEVAYLENDRNELEITRPVSLNEVVQNGQSAYDSLIANMEKFVKDNLDDDEITISRGFVEFEMDRNLFVSDFYQSHSFERIKDVRIRVSCDQDAQLSAELIMDSNRLFVKEGKYIDNRIGVQNIATSMATYECGCFDFNFKQDKFSPFEGAGIQSSWKLYLTAPKDFNPQSIKKITLFVSYTARNG